MRKVVEAFTAAIDANEGRATGDIEDNGLPAASAVHASVLATEDDATGDEDAEQPQLPPIGEHEGAKEGATPIDDYNVGDVSNEVTDQEA